VTSAARFVVIEGGDATGKSTQVARLVERLRETGREVVATFEPGATLLGARLRTLLLDDDAPVDPVAEVLHPALARGAWVVSDRFVPSSLAYQGVGRGLGVAEIEQLNALASRGIEPDLVVVLDLSLDAAKRRMGASRDRLEGEDDAFALAVHEAYRDLAEVRGWDVVDADAPPEAVADAVWAVVRDRLSL